MFTGMRVVVAAAIAYPLTVSAFFKLSPPDEPLLRRFPLRNVLGLCRALGVAQIQRAIALMVLSILTGVLQVACNSEPASETNPDAAASVGCRHYNNIALDAEDGVLSEAELVIKVREAYDDLKISEIPGLRQKAGAVVRDARNGDVSAFRKSWSVLASSCRTILENS